MGNFVARSSQFIYIDNEQEKILLDLNDFVKNKSRIPFHSIKGDRTVADIIVGLMDDHGEISEGTDEARYLNEYTLFDTLILERVVQTSQPVRAVEIGAGNGVLSYHLGTILGAFNKRSELSCICDTIGNGSEDRWINSICKIKKKDLPALRFAASDYDNTMLRDNAFDIVVINASVMINDEKRTIEEAKRLVMNKGRVFCISHENNWLLLDMFVYLFPSYEKFSLGERGFILRGN